MEKLSERIGAEYHGKNRGLRRAFLAAGRPSLQELFGKDLEVSAREAALQCRNLRVMSDNLMRGLRSVFSEIERHQSEIQRKSSRLVGSVVVLLFLPLLMLNFYSQFFAEGEIWSNSWTTDLFWIGIVIVEFGVLILLRARKWLGRRLT